jgi:hypothetical protein
MWVGTQHNKHEAGGDSYTADVADDNKSSTANHPKKAAYMSLTMVFYASVHGSKMAIHSDAAP